MSTTESAPFINYEHFNADKVFNNTPEVKQIPGQTGSSYQQIPLIYNYGEVEQPFIDALYLEGPRLKSSQGISSKMFNGKMAHSMGVTFPEADNNAMFFLQRCSELYARTAALLMHNKVNGLIKFDVNQQTLPGLYKDPIYRPKDTVTGEILPGRSASFYFKLNAGNYNQTLFTDLEGKKIDWKLLENSEVEFIPLLHISTIYIGGGKASLQIKMASAIVLSIVASGSVTRQASTIEAIVANNPDLVSKVAEQIAKLSLERRESASTNKDSAPTPAPALQGLAGLNNVLGAPANTAFTAPPSAYGFGTPTPSNQTNPVMTPIGIRQSPSLANFTPGKLQ